MKSLLLILFLLVFRSDALAQSPTPAKLPEGTTKVELHLYDYTVDLKQPRIETGGKLHPGLIAAYTTELKKEQIEVLLKALTQNHVQSDKFLCDFAPHHGIVFRGANNKILGSVSICFHCKELWSQTFPKIGHEFFSYWGWTELKALFKDSGLPILGSNEEYTELRNPTSQPSGAGQRTTAPDSKSEGRVKPQPEAEGHSR